MSANDRLRLLGVELRRRANRLSRVRWLKKLRIAAAMEGDLNILGRARYVLWDPEIESYSYELAHEPEMLAGIAAALGRDPGEVEGYAREAHSDPELHDRLARHLRGRIDVKHRPALGHRLGWYVIARALKPEVVVETGIYHGLGSLALLRALERNASDGVDGELLSFDMNPRAGSIVRRERWGRWRRFTGSTRELLEPALRDREVGLMIQDTSHDDENQTFEFGVVLAHAAPKLVLIDCSGGWAQTLPRLCAAQGGSYVVVPAGARNHVTWGNDLALGVFERGANEDA